MYNFGGFYSRGLGVQRFAETWGVELLGSYRYGLGFRA